MITKKDALLFGAHMSITGGLEKCFERGESIGCTAIQIFTKSNRSWHAKEITDNDASLFIETSKQSSIKSVVVHASYLINLGSENKITNDKSVYALIEEVKRCQKLGLRYLILHPGAKQGSTENECLNIISKNINHVFSETSDQVMILLENTAGMGSSVGYTFEQLAQIIDGVKNKKRIGICFDTCHAFAAGYDFSAESGYKKMWEEFDAILGINNLKAMHINDSKKECGSKVDRHEHIEKGKIGKEAFKLLFNDEKFLNIPKILETPIEIMEDFIPDMKRIIDLIEPKNQKMVLNTNLEQYLK